MSMEIFSVLAVNSKRNLNFNIFQSLRTYHDKCTEPSGEKINSILERSQNKYFFIPMFVQ